MKKCYKLRKSETETERQRDRETERQRDRETERQRDRETEKERDRETEKERDRETDEIRIIYMNSSLTNLSTSKISFQFILILRGQRGFLLADRCSLSDKSLVRP